MNVQESGLEFDPTRETFRWKGRFDQHRATYDHTASSGRTVLRLESDADTLEIVYTGREDQHPGGLLSRLPYRVELGAHHAWRDDLVHAELDGSSREAVQAVLESFFHSGVKAGIEELPEAVAERLEALLYGYRIFRRFLAFLEREYPAVLERVGAHRGVPFLQRLRAFVVGTESPEELLIELRRAVAEEDYERAAFIRDQITARQRESPPPGQDRPHTAT